MKTIKVDEYNYKLLETPDECLLRLINDKTAQEILVYYLSKCCRIKVTHISDTLIEYIDHLGNNNSLVLTKTKEDHNPFGINETFEFVRSENVKFIDIKVNDKYANIQ